MNEIRDLSDTETDAVAGGLQYNENTQNYLMAPPPAVSPVVGSKDGNES